MGCLPLDILIPLLLLPVVVFGGFVLYRRALGRLETDADRPDVSGGRLTSEHLRRLSAPQWRVVYEIGADRLSGVDHVVVGPPGVVAIATVMADRPLGEVSTDPTLIAAAATMRGAVDELAGRAGLHCDLLAKVFWGSPQPTEPAARAITHGTVGIVGQRLDEWLASLPAVLTGAQVDLGWQTIVTGIGRPDPLA